MNSKDRSTRLARRMRRTPAANETALWRLLRDRRLSGLKFRRQVPLGRFVADFVCLRYRLIVEADGPFHDVERDAERDAWLRAQGFVLLRFPNALVEGRPHEVLANIIEATLKIPSPLAGEGGPREGAG